MSTKAEIVVLGLLAEEPMHGYDLLERFHARGMGSWTELSRASVYQVLRRLERDGAATGRAQAGREGPERRVFRLTRQGRDRLIEGVVARARATGPIGSDADAALGFAHVLSGSSARATADARERTLRDRLEVVRAELERVTGSRGPGPAMSAAMLRRQEALVAAELAWLRSYRAALAKARR